MFEKLFENALWKSRFIVLLAVIFGFLGSVILFFVASIDVINVAKFIVITFLEGTHPDHFHEDIVAGIIGAVDLYLIAVVMLIFAFGLYELFISKIDAAESKEGNNILAIHSLDQLKDKIAKVIVMVLIVSFFPSDDHVATDLLSPMRAVLMLSLPSRVYLDVVVLAVPSGPVIVLSTVRRLPSWVAVKSPPPKPPRSGPPGRCPWPWGWPCGWLLTLFAALYVQLPVKFVFEPWAINAVGMRSAASTSSDMT